MTIRGDSNHQISKKPTWTGKEVVGTDEIHTWEVQLFAPTEPGVYDLLFGIYTDFP